MRSPGLGGVVLAIVGLAAGSPAIATDGVIEINQAKIVAGGGFPYTISAAGSYRLTSNLDAAAIATGPNTNLIAISANDVSLDLNGFAVIGVGGIGASNCVSSGIANNTRVSNGTVRNCPNSGIGIGKGSVDNVVVVNTGQGIFVSSGRVSNSYVTSAATNCINVNQGVVSNSVVEGCDSGGGIFVGDGLIEGSSAVNSINFGSGLRINSGVIRGSFASGNAGSEIDCSTGCALEANTLANCGGPCITGTYLQTPPNSNMCANAACP